MAKKKKEKNTLILFGLGAAALFAMGSKSNGGSGGSASHGGSGASRPISDKMLSDAFQKVLATYGSKIAGEAEQLYRKETRNFESGQFLKTYSPGMEQAAGKDEFPYGWGSLNTFLTQYPKYKGDYWLVPMTENNTGITKKYIAFPSLEAAVMFLAYTIKNRGFAGYWRSFDEAKANEYYASLKTYPIKYT